MCPYEPKFYLPIDKLEEHLKKCPKIVHDNKILDKKWYVKGVNVMYPQA